MDSVNSPVDGTRIAYRTFRSEAEGAPTVVLSHGTALSQAIWRGFGYVRALNRTHTVITVDLRGHGRSDGPHHETAYSMDAFVADLVAVLDRTETGAADYVGYSLGGRIGFSLGTAHPTRVNRFVSIAGAAGTEKGAFDRVFFPGCITALREGGMEGFLEGWQSWTGEQVDPATRHAFAANDAQALAAYMARSEEDPGVDDESLKHFTVPTQLIVGSLDRERVQAAEHVHQVLPGAELLIVDGATHGSILREPRTLETVTSFLTTPTA
ncbi:alpha/beta hydrolase [Kineosporia sp. J2-2]|uniref:Alpha/beta hydrolase n=1 Tax=Kineosporia corallincola TaxID=2835133 RepID=A0ABS5TAK6_9ACTN|nr:alpha/beta hydrolase [Kineosporia corallincola]MBT0768092.1 alpha/beta hydrolase [Kineosporia corallincola]